MWMRKTQTLKIIHNFSERKKLYKNLWIKIELCSRILLRKKQKHQQQQEKKIHQKIYENCNKTKHFDWHQNLSVLLFENVGDDGW